MKDAERADFSEDAWQKEQAANQRIRLTMKARETLARYRGLSCGVSYAEAIWAANVYPQEILQTGRI